MMEEMRCKRCNGLPYCHEHIGTTVGGKTVSNKLVRDENGRKKWTTVCTGYKPSPAAERILYSGQRR